MLKIVCDICGKEIDERELKKDFYGAYKSMRITTHYYSPNTQKWEERHELLMGCHTECMERFCKAAIEMARKGAESDGR